MMDDILKQINAGEVSGVQFKERIFDNRVEIHSPGALPNGLTIDDIKAGTSMPRNMFLFNNAIYLLPYTGVGSGITRALDEDVNVTFMNNDKAQEFVITVWREESNEVEKKSNQVGNQVEQKVTKSKRRVTKSRKKVTKSKTLTLDLDTLALKKCHCLISKGI